MILLKQLDLALDFFYDRITEYVSHDRLKSECFNNNSQIDVEGIILRFKEDKFIHGGLGNSGLEFKLTFAGRIYKENGGYHGHSETEKIERERISKLEQAHADQTTLLTAWTNKIAFWTAVVGIGTIALAVVEWLRYIYGNH